MGSFQPNLRLGYLYTLIMVGADVEVGGLDSVASSLNIRVESEEISHGYDQSQLIAPFRI